MATSRPFEVFQVLFLPRQRTCLRSCPRAPWSRGAMGIPGTRTCRSCEPRAARALNEPPAFERSRARSKGRRRWQLACVGTGGASHALSPRGAWNPRSETCRCALLRAGDRREGCGSLYARREGRFKGVRAFSRGRRLRGGWSGENAGRGSCPGVSLTANADHASK